MYFIVIMKTPSLYTFLIAAGLIGAIWYFSGTKEGFRYRGNPCDAHKSCKPCALAAGCGWCSDTKQCQPIALDGFPPRDELQRHICKPFSFIINEGRC